MPRQVSVALFEPVVTHFVSKILENGVKNWPKARFSKKDPRPLGMLFQVSSALFEPMATNLALTKITKKT